MLNIFKIEFSGLAVFRNSILMVGMLLLSGVALADRPEWAGSRGGDNDGENSHSRKHKHGHSKDEGDDERHEDGRDKRYQDRYILNQSGVEIQIGGFFADTQRYETHEYYKKKSRHGHCPPGLAKKHNGCVPPGIARKWTLGEELPRDVVYRPIEPAIQIKLGMPPVGHKFVHVATDILLIAIGSGLVVDAIQDLGQ